MSLIYSLALVACISQCACLSQELECGPAQGTVTTIVDGDTVDLASGERVRYLLVDTPELRGVKGADCFAAEASRFNRDLVQGRDVELRYDATCRDRFGRLLAYVAIGDVEINTRLVERGYACVLYIPPAGEQRRHAFDELEERARSEHRGMWGTCEQIACD